MSCNEYRECLLDFGWDKPARQRAEALLDHLKQCQDCRKAAGDYDRLRQLLAEPTESAAPPGGWERFEQQMHDSIGTGSSRHKVGGWHVPYPAVAATLVIGLVIGLLGFELGRLFTSGPKSSIASNDVHSQPLISRLPDNPAAPPQPISSERIAYDVRSFQRVAQFCENKASWVLLSKRYRDVGMAPTELDRSSPRVLLLGLTVLRGQQVISNADLMVIPGQQADLAVPLDDGQSLQYRIGTSVGQPTRLNLWLGVVTPNGGRPLAGLSTNLEMEPGQKLTAGRLMTAAGEYQLKIAFAEAELPASQR
jgi:hypothetical protein